MIVMNAVKKSRPFVEVRPEIEKAVGLVGKAGWGEIKIYLDERGINRVVPSPSYKVENGRSGKLKQRDCLDILAACATLHTSPNWIPSSPLGINYILVKIADYRLIEIDYGVGYFRREATKKA
jgi:hypothetical protein